MFSMNVFFVRSLLMNFFVQCLQAGFIPWVYKTSAANFETAKCAGVSGDVSEERCILLSLLFMPLFNVHIERHCELKYMDGLHLLV